MSKPSNKPRPPTPAPSGRPKAACLWPLGMPRPRGPLRPNHSAGNMTKPSRTWRHKSSEKKAEAKLNSSLPPRLPYMLAQGSSKACWWLLTFCWGRHPHPTHSPYHKGLPQQSKSLPQQIFPCQCPSSPPQTLWTACLWVEPHPRQPWKGPQLQMARCPTLEQGAQAELLRIIQSGH